MEDYSREEERMNVISHGIGFVLSVIGLILLLQLAFTHGTTIHVVSFSIFGSSLIILYGASTLYHSAKDPQRRHQLRVLDHASIYLLIAGSYTPFTLISMAGTSAAYLFYVSWVLAITGISLKLFFTGRFKVLSTILYVLIGSIIFLDIDPLIQNVPSQGMNWVLIGGASYLISGVLYNMKSIKYNHAIFHLFVMAGSFCHFIAVYCYIL